ncbi:MAG: signal recognition particle-docking protein FtsY [Oscillospiraceae bacterium]|jgi:fused signal recognition particle receptor|nr:signal recognition particle-docking protein FtsY [Oscillospiraceae bacterium]
MSFFDKIKKGLEKTRKAVSGQIEELFGGFVRADDEFFDELEETLILGDIGVETSLKAVEALKARAKSEKLKSSEEIKAALADILRGFLENGEPEVRLDTRPSVILVIGVNGVGKTTTIGKLASLYAGEGKKVLLCAADTFRAAAADQLEIWAGRSGVQIVRQNEGSDPAAVVYDACAAAKARGCDVVICDTAGRLHNKQNLMNELSKISRIIDRELPGCSRETLLVIDATTGQNGLMQAAQFKEAANVSGVVLTKLDGTAKGGIVIAIADTLGIPVKFIGVGEKVDDLTPFEAKSFIEALL